MRVTAAILALVGLGFFAGGVYRELRGSDASAEGLPVLRYELPSTLLGRRVQEVAIVPPKSRGLVVLLQERAVTPRLLSGVRDLGAGAPAVLLVGGRPGQAPQGRYGSYVLVEAIPDALERFRLGNRVAIGGTGAPALARLDRGRFCSARADGELHPLARSLRDCRK